MKRKSKDGGGESTKSKDKALFQAVSSGKLDEVKAALAKGANVNAKDEEGESALNRAADEGHFEIVKSLVENGADLNNKGTNDKTPLMYAIYSREPKESHNAIIPYLVGKRAEVSNDLMMRVKIKVDILKENTERGMVLPEAAEAWERLFSYLKVARARQDFAQLVQGLSNKESDVRRDAADYALATLFTFDDMDISEAVPALQKLLGDADEQTRRYAASCLCIHFASRKDVAALKELFADKDDAVRAQATYAVIQQLQLKRDASIARKIVEGLEKDENKRVRELAGKASALFDEA